MKKKDKTKKGNKRYDAEDYYDIRKSMSKSFKSKRKKDKKYLSDVLGGEIDMEDYYDYNDIH